MTSNPLLNKPRIRYRRESRACFLLFLIGMILPAMAAADEHDNGEEHLRAAEIALQNHEYKKAATEYRLAATLSGRAETARQATRVAYTYGFNEDALESALRWAELDEDSDEAVLYVAQLQLRLGETRKARYSFRDLLRRNSSDAGESLVSLVPILSREDPQDAFDVMRWLARPHRDSADANYAVGVMALQAGDHDEASKRAQRAIELNKEWVKPQLLYARSLLLAGKKDEAIDYAARIVGDNPQPDPEARMELAILYMSAGRDDDALSQVNQILLEQPSRTDALRLMAIINFRQENLDAARADFQDLLSSGRYTMDALYYLARIADYRGERERALSLYSQVSSGQNVVVSQRRASSIIMGEGSLDQAMNHLQEFGETHPNYAVDMLHAQAMLLASQQENERALEIYDRVVSYRPDSVRVILGRGEVMLRTGKDEEAIAEYRRALRRWPDNALVLNALGYTLTYYGDDYREAERLISKALKLAPESAAIIDSYGWVLYRLGEHEKALVHLQDAWSRLKDPEVAAHIVEVLWVLDRHDEAAKMLAEAESLFSSHPMLEDMREKIDAGDN